jgi:hypothetical protein
VQRVVTALALDSGTTEPIDEQSRFGHVLVDDEDQLQRHVVCAPIHDWPTSNAFDRRNQPFDIQATDSGVVLEGHKLAEQNLGVEVRQGSAGVNGFILGADEATENHSNW